MNLEEILQIELFWEKMTTRQGPYIRVFTRENFNDRPSTKKVRSPTERLLIRPWKISTELS